MKVGIIGCGKVALEGHIPAFRQLGLEIVGVADSNRAALKKIGVRRRYTNYRELLKQNLDVVSICTPPFLHHKMCIDALEQGINVLVEKPLALSVKEGMEIKKKVEGSEVKLSVMHNYKFLGPLSKAKRMHEIGQLGRLLSIHTISHSSSPSAWKNWRMNEEEAGSMILQWNHPLYLQAWFGGNPKSVFAIGKKIISNYPLITDVRALIDFGDYTGFLEMSQFSNSPQFLLNVTGTGSSVMIKLPTKLRILASSTPIDALEDVFTSFSNVGKLFRMYLVMQGKPHLRYTWGSHFRLIKKFIESIKNDTEVPATVDEGILSIRLAKAIEESMHSGEKILL
jgi:predicted dehydrogenase